MPNDNQNVKQLFSSPISVKDVEYFKLVTDELSKNIGITNYVCKSFIWNIKI